MAATSGTGGNLPATLHAIATALELGTLALGPYSLDWSADGRLRVDIVVVGGMGDSIARAHGEMERQRLGLRR